MYLDQALTQLHVEGYHADKKDIERLSPPGHEHLNFLGRYTFALPEEIQRGGYRPLREPAEQPLEISERTQAR